MPHGGKRPGAGRKPGPHTTMVSVRLPDAVAERLRMLAEREGLSIGKLLEMLIAGMR